MTANKAYTVYYRMYKHGEAKSAVALAKNKADAYYKVIDAIEKVQGSSPYSAWVYSVTYKNGNYRRFNTCEGNAY